MASKYRGYTIEKCYGDNYCISGPGVYDRTPLVNLKTAKKYVDIHIAERTSARGTKARKRSR
jgi:hypothetical protein